MFWRMTPTPQVCKISPCACPPTHLLCKCTGVNSPPTSTHLNSSAAYCPVSHLVSSPKTLLYVTALAQSSSLLLYDNFPISSILIAALSCIQSISLPATEHNKHMGSNSFFSARLSCQPNWVSLWHQSHFHRTDWSHSPGLILMAIIISHGNQNKSLKKIF